MNRPRLLDLFCKAGGASAGRWPRYCSQACRQAAYRDRHTHRRTA